MATTLKGIGLPEARFVRGRCSQETLARAVRKLGARQMTRDRLARIELEELFATEDEGKKLAEALSNMEVTRLGKLVTVRVEQLGLRLDPYGATRGRRPSASEASA